MLSHDVFYRVRQADGKTFVSASRAWDLDRFRKSLAKSYAEAKDGPHVVEFITQGDYESERERRRK